MLGSGLTGTCASSYPPGACDITAMVAAQEASGPVLSLVHGQTSLSIAFSEHSLRALGLAVLTSIGDAAC